MLWHMLLFGDAFFGPAYGIFIFFCIQSCSLLLGSNFKKCLQQAIITLLYTVSGVHSNVVFNACVYSSMYACMQSTLSVWTQQYDPETYLET